MATTMAQLDDSELVTELAKREFELVRARFAHSANRLQNTSGLRSLRKDVARIRTELRRREIAAGLLKDELLRQHRVDPGALRATGGDGDGGSLLAGVVDRLGE